MNPKHLYFLGVYLSIVAATAISAVPAYAAQAKPSLPISAICVEAETGVVLHEENALVKRPPASMLKLMQMLLVTEGIAAGKWTLDTSVTASKEAQRMGGTQVFLEEGETWPLRDMLKALAVASANDAAVAIAETFWGSKEDFLKAMNARAKELGMDDTTYHSVHGLPPERGGEFDVTTAKDMVILARECVKYPEILQLTSLKEATFRGGNTPYHSTNKMLLRMNDCDGLKTGFIRAAGFCVTATAKRNDIRLIAVVMGAGKNEQFSRAKQLLEDGFARIGRVKILAKDEPIGEAVPVDNCEIEHIRLVPAEDVWALMAKDDVKRLEFRPSHPIPLEPPLRAGDIAGELHVILRGDTIARAPLTTPQTLKPKAWRLRIQDGVAKWEHLDITDSK